jgi:hypothetical protein
MEQTMNKLQEVTMDNGGTGLSPPLMEEENLTDEQREAEALEQEAEYEKEIQE